MRSVRVIPGMTAVLVSLVVVAVAGCDPLSSSSSSAAPASSTATAASQPASPAASAAAAAPAAPGAASSGGVENLVASAAVKSQLLAAFAAAKDVPVSDVAGSDPGSVYYAYDPATQTYWAKATYAPASTDPQSVADAFQDGTSNGFFKESGSGPWQAEIGGEPVTCGVLKFFPQSVLVVWSLPTSATPASMC